MKKLYIALALLVSGTALGQIEQNINKPTGTVSNAIFLISSFAFTPDNFRALGYSVRCIKD
jgi:hypothetical protein